MNHYLVSNEDYDKLQNPTLETLQLQADTLNHSVLDKTKLADLEKLAYNPDLDHLQKVLKEIDYEALPKQELKP